jgi:hypothetical protein
LFEKVKKVAIATFFIAILFKITALQGSIHPPFAFDLVL